jgi:teichuronic acid biosynthesis glycosyltransferase TuaG
MPRVSVIVPAFNAARYLLGALASVDAQTYRDWEVLVADDASTDGTADVAKNFSDRVKVLRTSINAGPGAARNRAIEASTAELLAFLDADDLWLPEYLEQQVALYDEQRARRNDVGLVVCDARILGPDGYRDQTYMEAVQFPAEVTLTGLMVANPIFISTLSPRSIVEEAGCFFPAALATADYDLWLRIVERGYRVVANRRPLAVYRLTPGAISTRLDEGATALRLTYRRALERGNLTRRQRRIARRQMRFSRALETKASLVAKRREGRLRYSDVARAVPLLLLVKLEHPNQWLDSIRYVLGRPTSNSALDRPSD